MKFKYSVSPNYNDKITTKDIMNDVLIALVFVAVCSIILQYIIYGFTASIRAFLIIALAMFTCWLVDVIFYKVKKLTPAQIKQRTRQNVPLITGLILALTLPLGNLDSLAMYYVTIISAIIAELFGKLLFGGFGYNIFNPAALGRGIALLAFGKYLIIPTIDALSNSTPLATMQDHSVSMSVVSESFGNMHSLLFGVYGGMIGETVSIPIIIAFLYLLARKVINWTIPVVSFIAMFIFSGVLALLNNYGFDYVLVQLFGGGFLFGIVFMLTDPVTNPNSKQGKIIIAIIFSLLTILIRYSANLPEGVLFAILIVNMLVPMIDNFTANVTTKKQGAKYASILITLVISISLVIIFNYI